jgi:Arc/MetJ-type ribon-helix-helix transcriptional regulator
MLSEKFKNLHLQLSMEDIHKIDQWKVKNGMKSRSEAIRSMIRLATADDSSSQSSYESSSMSEKSNSDFINPSAKKDNFDDNSTIEELVRKLIKEELNKNNNS